MTPDPREPGSLKNPPLAWHALPLAQLLWCIVLALLLSFTAMKLPAAQQQFRVGTGDILRIKVFQSPDLSTDARVSEEGTISFPLLGNVPVAGSTLPAVEKELAKRLQDGGFVLKPQVNILIVEGVSNQVTVFGRVNHAGIFSIEKAGGRLSGALAAAGGIAPDGSDVVVITGTRDSRPYSKEIDIVNLFRAGNLADDVVLSGGDTVFVDRAPEFFIYGEVQRPGNFRLQRGMTVMQALATGGGMTPSGTTRGIVIHRTGSDGKVNEIKADLETKLQNQDTVYVRQAIF